MSYRLNKTKKYLKQTGLWIIAALLLLSAAGCKSKPKPDPGDRDLTNNVKLLAAEEANKHDFAGIGAEWDAFFFMPFNQQYGLTEADWKLNLSRIKGMKLKTVRTMVTPQYFEPENDDDDPFSNNRDGFKLDSEHMKSLVKQLDFCEENGITVTLSYHGVPSNMWLAYPGTVTWSAPNNLDEFAENVTMLVRFIKEEKDYSCVKFLNLFNEPNIAFATPESDPNNEWIKGDPEKKYYIEMVKAVDERLRSEKLRDKIKLVVSDDSEDLQYMKDVYEGLKDVGDIVSSHNYMFTDLSTNSQISNWATGLINYINLVDNSKPHFLYEIGNKNTIDAYHAGDLYDFERGFFLPKILINYLNAGGTGMSYWTLYDQLYYQGPAQNAKMCFGLWGFKDENWELRPTFHAVSLMSEFTDIGAKIYPLTSTDSFVSATKLVNPDKSVTYFVYNSQREKKKFYIEDTGAVNSDYFVYEFSRESSASQESFHNSIGKGSMDGYILQDVITAESFRVYHMESE